MRFRDQRIAQIAELIPAGFQVSRSLGLALSLYVERRKALSPARRQEISRCLGPLLCRRFNLPLDIDYDLLLCGLYQKSFLGSAPVETAARVVAATPSPKAGVA